MDKIIEKCQGLTPQETKILQMKFPRKINQSEQEKINRNLSQTSPETLFFSKTYNDKIIDFIANPKTKALILCCYLLISLLILKELNILKFIFNIKYIEIYLTFIVVFGIITYNQQRNINDNILWMVQRLPNDPTYGDYLAKQPKADNHKSIFNQISTILLTSLIAGLIDLTRKNPMLTKIF